MKKPPPRSYLILATLAGGVLFWVLHLQGAENGPPRGPLDWVVLGLVLLAIAYNLVRLGMRLHRIGGGKEVWHLLRTLGFWLIGLFNTVWARPEDVGSWRTWGGIAMLLLALFDSLLLLRTELSGSPAKVEAVQPPS